MTLFARMKRKRFFDTPAAREFHPKPRFSGCYHLPESAKSLAHARRLRAGLPEPLSWSGAFQLFLEWLALLSVGVFSAAFLFWEALRVESAEHAAVAFSVMCWAGGAAVGIAVVLLTFSLCRRG